MSDKSPANTSEAPSPEGAAVAPIECWSIGTLALVQGLLASWAAWILPWQHVSAFGIACGLLGGLHIATAAAMLARHPKALSLWKLSSLWALLLLLLVTWQVFTGGAYLTGLYGSLGQGLFAALIAIWGLFVLVIVPTAVWSLVRARHVWPKLGRAPWIGGASAVVIVALASAWNQQLGAIPHVDTDALDTAVSDLRWLVGELPAGPKASARKHRLWRSSNVASIQCDEAPENVPTTLIATYASLKRRGGLESRCVQAESPSAAVEQLKAILQARATGPSIKLDAITSHTPPLAGPAWTHAFALRPAQDGLCVGGRCWMPWQLLARDAYVQYRPLPFIPDLAFGADVDGLAAQLREEGPSESASAAARRVTTRSWTLTEAGATELHRLRPVELDESPESVSAAARELERHIVRAQLDSGKFRYTLHPFSGRAQKKNFNLARQAGTLLALCELGRNTKPVRRTIKRGLKLLERYERVDVSGEVSGLSRVKHPERVQLSDSALPLVAFTQCRGRVGKQFDQQIARLARLVLKLQRDDGGFSPAFDLTDSNVIRGTEPLYAPGQAILGLALLETILSDAPIEGWPNIDEVRGARLKAMRYVAAHHWPASLYPYFFVEENWNCLAARASLTLERVDAYERFCFDYVRFKSRLILDQDSDVDPMFVGGFGFGNVIPPHNTGAAGFAEALSAAIAVKHARDESADEMKERLSDIMRFLLRQQWTEQNCFGCRRNALGAISEHTHSAISRIDFAQHTWAALGHGSSALAL